MIKQAIIKLVNRQDLNEVEAKDSIVEIMKGIATDAQIASFLTAMTMKGVTAEELTYFVKAIQEGTEFIAPKAKNLVDISGTGGDILNAFNVNTTAAFVAAGAGCNVAKHVSRSAAGLSGSAELLEELGINLNVKLKEMQGIIEKVGLGFLFMPLHVKTLDYIQKKVQLGIRTSFNLLSPLITPVKAKNRLLGAYSEKACEKMAKALQGLEVEKALIVHGLNGLDTLSTLGKTRVIELSKGKLDSKVYVPETFGFKAVDVREIRGGSPKENAVLLTGILEGAKGAKADIVLLNAGAAIYVGGKANSINEGIELARETIQAGKALEKLEQLKKETRKYRK